jgi:two-component system chemotaxis response regulator CheB
VVLREQLEAIKTVISGLPTQLPAAIFLVLHIGANPSDLPRLLNHTVGTLPVSYPKDGEPIQLGHIYVAPSDHHMGIEQGRIRLTRGQRKTGRVLPSTHYFAAQRDPMGPMLSV